MTNIEQLYDINYPNLSHYKISESGTIYRLRGPGGYPLSSPKIVATELHKGYLTVRLTPDDKSQRKWFSVHRLYALTFIPNPNNCPVINHKDKDRTNVSMENLEWTTVVENNRHEQSVGAHKKGTPCTLYVGNVSIGLFPSISDAAYYATTNYPIRQKARLLQKLQTETLDGELVKIVREGIDTESYNAKRKALYTDKGRHRSTPRQNYSLFCEDVLINSFSTKNNSSFSLVISTELS